MMRAAQLSCRNMDGAITSPVMAHIGNRASKLASHLLQLVDPEMPPLKRNSLSVSSLALVPQHLVSTTISAPCFVGTLRPATPEALCRADNVALGIEMVSEPGHVAAFAPSQCRFNSSSLTLLQ